MLFALLTAIIAVEGRDTPRNRFPDVVAQSKQDEIPEGGMVYRDQLAEFHLFLQDIPLFRLVREESSMKCEAFAWFCGTFFLLFGPVILLYLVAKSSFFPG